jgi:hypothetical protein
MPANCCSRGWVWAGKGPSPDRHARRHDVPGGGRMNHPSPIATAQKMNAWLPVCRRTRTHGSPAGAGGTACRRHGEAAPMTDGTEHRTVGRPHPGAPCIGDARQRRAGVVRGPILTPPSYRLGQVGLPPWSDRRVATLPPTRHMNRDCAQRSRGIRAGKTSNADGADTMRHVRPALFLLAIAILAAGCACRPGYVGPGGVRPARCWVW